MKIKGFLSVSPLSGKKTQFGAEESGTRSRTSASDSSRSVTQQFLSTIASRQEIRMEMTSRGAFARGTQRRIAARKIVGLATSALLISSLLTAGPASAAVCGASDLVPQVRGYSINQGLGSYANLVRGKDVLFRLFLSRPACADGTTASVALAGAQLNIKTATGTVLSVPAPTNSLVPPPLLAYYKDAPAVGDSTGDPKWLIDGAQLAAATPSASTPLTFEAVLTYNNSAGVSRAVLPAVSSFGNRPIQKTLLAATLPLRVLAIPMGDGAKAISTQFTDNARAAVLEGFKHLGRMFPVADETRDLTQTSATDPLTVGGVRYHLNTNTQVDVSADMVNGIFCDSGSALKNRIAPQLQANLKQYNTANPLNKSADNVMGVIDQSISSNNCFDGYALVNSKFSYVRALYGANPIASGALMGMEVAHNFGTVPCGTATGTTECPVDRDAKGDKHHAQNTWAHSVNAAHYPDLAYNLLSPTAFREPVADDKNVMQYAFQDKDEWLNGTTFLEASDWALLSCKLGGPSTDDCVLPLDTSGATAGAGAVATPTTTVVGTTDGTKPGTTVFDSYAEAPGFADVARSSHIHLIQRDSSGNVVQDDPVRLTDDGGDGHHGGATHSDLKVFSVSYETHDLATRLQLVNVSTGEILYQRGKAGGGPRDVETTVTMLGGGGDTGCTVDCPPPSEMTNQDEFGADAETIDFEVNPETGAPYSAGDVVTTQYVSSHRVLFNDDADSTPKIIGNCLQADDPCRFPPGTPTQSGRFGLWNSPDTLPVGPVDPVPDSSGKPLRVNFIQPVQKVGLFMGNDDTSNAVATLTAYNAAGIEIESVTKRAFGAANTTFIGIDAGQANVASIELDYGDSVFGEEIDDLIFERPGGQTTPTTSYRAVVQASDDAPNDMRAAFFAKCPSVNEILAAGQKPDDVEGDRATFHYDFDANEVCRNGSSTTILVRLNDGYNQTNFFEISVEGGEVEPPIASIESPAAAAEAYSVLQREPITLTGQGWDAREGVLPGDRLSWRVSGPSGVVADGVTGNSPTLAVPASGSWVPGTYTAQLTVTNSAGLSDTTSSMFDVLEDKDNDGVPITVEGCYRGSDNDPSDAFGDFDGDGVPNQQDEEPCKARSDYEGNANFDPNVLNYPSQGTATSVTMTVTLRYRDLAQVDGKTVRITRLGGADVPATAAFEATGWSIKSNPQGVEATAKFDRQAIIDFLCPSPSECQTNQTVWISITGDAPGSKGKPAFSFIASDDFQVQKG